MTATHSDSDVERIVHHVRLLDQVAPPAGYDELGLAVLDAIYSISVRYGSVEAVLQRYRKHRRQEGQEPAHDTAADLVAAIEAAGGPEAFALDVVCNKGRTSTRNGILKAEAVYQAAQVLVKHDVGEAAELRAVVEAGDADPIKDEWRAIRGQRSGITWRYLLILARTDNVKPDRMILRFLQDTLGRPVSREEAVTLVTASARELGASAREVDHRIWHATRRQRASSRA